MDPGRDPTAGLFTGLIVVGTVKIWCTRRSPYVTISQLKWPNGIGADVQLVISKQKGELVALDGIGLVISRCYHVL